MDNRSDEKANRLLEGAYALKTPVDNIIYYRDFASHYDTSFADALGYIYPSVIAKAFVTALASDGFPGGRVLDVGCGTGLVAAEMRDAGFGGAIDGVDLSAEMLRQAETKGLYQNLHEADLTGDLAHLPHNYSALVSAGTFTHGHLGPDPLVSLIALCQSGARAVIGINAAHYDAMGFAPVLDGLVTSKIVRDLRMREVKIYDGTDPLHADDVAFVLEFCIT